METIKNGFGIRIRKCCASCAWKDFRTENTRTCRLYETKVFPDAVCPSYQMRDEFSQAGNPSDGMVRRKEWMDYYFKMHTIAGKKSATPTETLARKWEKDNGSRFIIT